MDKNIWTSQQRRVLTPTDISARILTPPIAKGETSDEESFVESSTSFPAKDNSKKLKVLNNLDGITFSFSILN
jgi:hypothetical protein